MTLTRQTWTQLMSALMEYDKRLWPIVAMLPSYIPYLSDQCDINVLVNDLNHPTALGSTPNVQPIVLDLDYSEFPLCVRQKSNGRPLQFHVRWYHHLTHQSMLFAMYQSTLSTHSHRHHLWCDEGASNIWQQNSCIRNALFPGDDQWLRRCAPLETVERKSNFVNNELITHLDHRCYSCVYFKRSAFHVLQTEFIGSHQMKGKVFQNDSGSQI